MFKSNHVYIGKVEKGSVDNTFKYEFADGFTKKDIDSVVPMCSCTQCIATDDGIIASFKDDHVKSWNEDTINQNRRFYPEGYVTDNYITVYLKDGREREFQRADGGYFNNPEKNRIILSFSTYVKF